MQAALPPLVIDALVQTDEIALEDEACQTEKSVGIDCKVQANPESRSFSTQTIKVEADLVNLSAAPNLCQSLSTGSQKSKKRKIDLTARAINLRITKEILESILHNPKQFTQIKTNDAAHLCMFLKVNKKNDPWP